MRQGVPISEAATEKIARLLRETDLTASAIGERFGVSKAVVLGINKRFQIRDYDGKHSSFHVGSELRDGSLTIR